jgi:hypothetical protein
MLVAGGHETEQKEREMHRRDELTVQRQMNINTEGEGMLFGHTMDTSSSIKKMYSAVKFNLQFFYYYHLHYHNHHHHLLLLLLLLLNFTLHTCIPGFVKNTV